MAEVTAFRNNALPYPVYGVPYTVVFPLLDADGDPVTGATCDSEISKNGDTGVDCTNEGTEITFTTATNKGMYYLTLTADEMTADIATITTYSATSKATCITLYPRKLALVYGPNATAYGGDADTIILNPAAPANDNEWAGCLCVAVIDGNVEARVIDYYTASTRTAHVVPQWNVVPDDDDTYTIYATEGMMMRGTNAANTTTPDAAGTLAGLIGAKGGIPKLDSTNGLKVVGFGDADATVPTVTTLTNTVTLADGAHGGSGTVITLQTPIVASGNWATVGAKMDLADSLNQTGVSDLKSKLGTVPASGNWNTVTPDAAGTAGTLIGNLQTHGDGAWVTATDFATATNVTDARDAIEAYGDLNWATATNFATPTNITAASGIQLASSQHVIVDSGTVTTLTNAPTDMAKDSTVAKEATLTAIKGDGWTDETLVAIKDAVDGVGGGGDATAENQATIITHLTDIKGATWDGDTDALEDISDGIGLLGGGAGLPTATITVKDTDTDGDPIVGVTVYVYDSANAVKLAQGLTNASGVAAIVVPGDATYKVRLYSATWTQSTNPETLVVSGDTADEYYMTEFKPSEQNGSTTTTLYGTLRTAAGEAYEDATVSARLVSPGVFDANDVAISVDAVTTTTGETGYWELELLRKATYEITIEAHGVESREIEIGDVARLAYEAAMRG